MAENQFKQVLEKEITCPLCLDLFKEPKKLPCDHVYCKECLRGLALRSLNTTISCPECRTFTQVPGNGVNNFPTAFQTNRLIEVFQQIKLQAETSLPIDPDTCQTHPTQSLALYCETCKKQLCRDCVLMSGNHSTHKYGFFKDFAPKYRERVLSVLSLVKNQGESVKNALTETVNMKSSVISHAAECQENIDQAFDGLFSILQDHKEAMKTEVEAYYNSLRSQHKEQEEQLKKLEDELEEVAVSVEAAVQEEDQTFLLNMESTIV